MHTLKDSIDQPIRNKQKEQEAQSAKRVFCFLYVEHLFFYFVTNFVTVPDIHQHLPSSSLPLVDDYL
jgi:hypothetical protein